MGIVERAEIERLGVIALPQIVPREYFNRGAHSLGDPFGVAFIAGQRVQGSQTPHQPERALVGQKHPCAALRIAVVPSPIPRIEVLIGAINIVEQMLPAIDDDTIVWMDKRNGNWDIYGAMLTREKED